MTFNLALRAPKAWTAAVQIGALTLLLEASGGTAITNRAAAADVLRERRSAAQKTSTIDASNPIRTADYSQAIEEARKIGVGFTSRERPDFTMG